MYSTLSLPDHIFVVIVFKLLMQPLYPGLPSGFDVVVDTAVPDLSSLLNVRSVGVCD